MLLVTMALSAKGVPSGTLLQMAALILRVEFMILLVAATGRSVISAQFVQALEGPRAVRERVVKAMTVRIVITAELYHIWHPAVTPTMVGLEVLRQFDTIRPEFRILVTTKRLEGALYMKANNSEILLVMLASFVVAGNVFGESEGEHWEWASSVIENSVTHARIKATKSGTNLTISDIKDLNGTTVLDFTKPVFDADDGTEYTITGVTGYTVYGASKGLTEVYLPDTITFLDAHIFRASGTLKKVRLPQNVKELPIWLCGDCSKLETIVDGFPPNVTNVGEYAFSNCSSLATEIDFSRLVVIGKSAFASASSLLVPDGRLVLSNAIEVGASAFNSMTQIYEVDLTKTRNLRSICGFAYTSVTNIVPMYPPTVTEITSHSQKLSTLRGDVVISNPEFTSIPQNCWYGTNIKSLDMTGSGIESQLGNGAMGANAGNFSTNIVFSEVFNAFPNIDWFYNSSSRGTIAQYYRFRGDPPSIARSYGFSANNILMLPAWNEKWWSLLNDPSAYPDETVAETTFSETAWADLKQFHSMYPDLPLPTHKIKYGGYSTTYFALWYPYAPTSKTKVPICYRDALAYDGKSLVVTGGNDGASSGYGPTNLFDGTTYITNFIITGMHGAADRDFATLRQKHRWLGSVGAYAECAIPQDAPITRSLKLKSYRVHQLSSDEYANARAPKSWRLRGKVAGSDEWLTVDERSGVVWESESDPDAYPYAEKGQVPPRLKCFRDFDVPDAGQRVYVALRFEPTSSYLTESASSQAYVYGLTELEFFGEIPSPDPILNSFAASRQGWKDLAFTVDVRSIGEGAASAEGVVEVSQTSDFAEIVARSDALGVSSGAPTVLTVNGLTPDVEYFARIKVTNDRAGEVVRGLDAPVRTADKPFELGQISTVTDDGVTTVSVEVKAVYTDEATLELFGGASLNPTEKLGSIVVQSSGSYDFGGIAAPEGFAFFKAVLSATVGGVVYSDSTRKGISDFWVADDDSAPTRISNAANGMALGVAKTDEGLLLTSIIDLGAETKLDLSTKVYGPTGIAMKLVSVGTVLQQNAQLHEIVLSDDMTTIPASAFQGDASTLLPNSALEKVTLPKDLKNIPSKCFKFCKKLTCVLPNDWTLAVTNIGANAFDSTAVGGDLVFPAIVSFGTECFMNSQLTSLDLTGAPVERLDGFRGCSSLTNLSPCVSPSVTYVGSFWGANKLKQDLIFRNKKITKVESSGLRDSGFTLVDMRESRVVDIPSGYFSQCSMRELLLPKTLKTFGTGDVDIKTLFGCNSLKKITFLGNPPTGFTTSPEHVFDYSNFMLVVPNNSAWRTFFADTTKCSATFGVSAEQMETFKEAFPDEKKPDGMVAWPVGATPRYFRFAEGRGFAVFVR